MQTFNSLPLVKQELLTLPGVNSDAPEYVIFQSEIKLKI
jgi:hypothetical protein